MSQSKRWCFTLNNYSDAEYAAVRGADTLYGVVGKETGESNTPHLQGFLIFHTNKRLNAVKAVSSRAHWETARGNNEQAADYCKKDGDFEEWGTMPDSSNRRSGEQEKQRWADAKRACIENRILDVPDDIYMRYYRTCKEIAKDHMAKPDDLDEIPGIWVWGPPGVGKSYSVRKDYPDAYMKMQNKWWDGYQAQEFVILDDFDSKELGHLLKIWADKYAFLAETKGGMQYIRPKKFIITSNYSIEEMDWPNQAMRDAICRRFKQIHMVTAEWREAPPAERAE